jgi:hypothetical protein
MIFESEWQKLYHAAVLETDWTQMPQRIAAAEAAIRRNWRNSLKITAGQ